MTTLSTSAPAKPTKIRRNRTDWLNHVDAWKSSGLTQQAYCQSKGLCYRQFSRWKGRFKKENALSNTGVEAAFVPIKVSSTRKAANGDVIRLILPNKIEVHLRDAASAVALIERLAMLSC